MANISALFGNNAIIQNDSISPYVVKNYPVAANVTVNEPVYFDRGVGIVSTATGNFFIGYALETITAGNNANLLIKNSGEFEYLTAAVGDEICIDDTGFLLLNNINGCIGYCIEAGKIRLYDNSENLIYYPTKVDTSTISLDDSPGTVSVIANLDGYGILKKIQLSPSGADATIFNLTLDYNNITDIISVNQVIKDNNFIEIPVDVEYREGMIVTARVYRNTAISSVLSTFTYFKGVI